MWVVQHNRHLRCCESERGRQPEKLAKTEERNLVVQKDRDSL